MWDAKCDDAFGQLKQLLRSNSIFVSPNLHWEFILQTDASDRAVGAVLSQISAAEHPLEVSVKSCYLKRSGILRGRKNAMLLSWELMHLKYLLG